MRHFLVVLILTIAFTGCTAPRATPLPPSEPLPVLTPPPESTGDPRAESLQNIVPTPSFTLDEEPLQGRISEIPSVILWRERQAKADVAAYLKTTTRQLDYVNPGLGDFVEPDTVLVVPPLYRTDGESLSEVAAQTGLPEDVLLAANPGLIQGTTLPPGTTLVVPGILIVDQDTPLSGAAERLGTSTESLLSANPELNDGSNVLMGTVLVVPPEPGQR